MTNRVSCILFAAILLLCSVFAHSQSVSLFNGGQFVSQLQNGTPNAFGCVFTYQSGTSTPQASYTDYTGATQNANPVILTAGGTANIWLLTGDLYSITVKSFGGTNCSSGSTVYTASGINSTLLNTANTWLQPQTFDATTYFVLPDSQFVFGSSGAQTTFDVPPPSGNIILHFPSNASQSILGNQSPPITTPVINGTEVVNTPGTYWTLTNATPTGTVINALAILGGSAASNATVATTSTTTGILGICVLNCGNTGAATIQQSGVAPCIFDGATTFNDAVVPSTTTAGDCHDSGLAATANSIATVLSTNASTGTYSVLLAGGSGSGGRVICAIGTSVTVNASTTSQQPMQTCTPGAGSLNALGKSFRMTTTVTGASVSGDATVALGWGATSSLGTYATVATQGSTSAFAIDVQMVCIVTTAGNSGALYCTNITNALGITANPPPFHLTSVNLTAALTFGFSCSFGGSSTSNNCTEQTLLFEQIN